MQTVIEVKSREELAEYLTRKGQFALGDEVVPSEIKFQHVGYDERTRWDTYYVLIDVMGIVGLSDGKFDISQKTKSGEP